MAMTDRLRDKAIIVVGAGHRDRGSHCEAPVCRRCQGLYRRHQYRGSRGTGRGAFGRGGTPPSPGRSTWRRKPQWSRRLPPRWKNSGDSTAPTSMPPTSGSFTTTAMRWKKISRCSTGPFLSISGGTCCAHGLCCRTCWPMTGAPSSTPAPGRQSRASRPGRLTPRRRRDSRR